MKIKRNFARLGKRTKNTKLPESCTQTLVFHDAPIVPCCYVYSYLGIRFEDVRWHIQFHRELGKNWKKWNLNSLNNTDNCNKNEQKLEESYLTVLLHFELHRGIVNILQYRNHNIVRKRRNRNRRSRYCRHHSWPFRDRSPPFLRQLENFGIVIESVPSKERKSQPSVKPGPRTGIFRTLISLPHRQSKILKF